MTKAAMERLKKSKFFHEVCDIITAWDYYLSANDRASAGECMHRWSMAKLALEHITGNIYGFSRNGETVSIVNERDYNDRIFIAEAMRPKEVEREQYIETPRGKFRLVNMTMEEARESGYGMHFAHEGFAIMNRDNMAVAIRTA